MILSRLLSRLSRGDDAALGALIERETPHLRAFLRNKVPARLLRRVGISDIVQQTALKLVAARPRWTNQGAKAFRKLLELIAERTLINNLKHEHAQKRDLLRQEKTSLGRGTSSTGRRRSMSRLPGKDSTPSEILQRREKIEGVQACFALLSTQDQRIVRLIDHDQLRHAEAAKKLGISVEASRQRYRRAIARLKALFEVAGIVRD